MRPALAVAVVAFLAGRTGPGPPAEPSGTGAPGTSASPEASSGPTEGGGLAPDSAVFVHLHRSAWVNRTSGDARAHGDFGHHCAGARWTEEPPSVVVYDWSWRSSSPGPSAGPSSSAGYPTPEARGGDVWPASGLLGVTYDGMDQTPSFSRVGVGPTVHPFDAEAGAFGIRSAFEASRIVANLTATDGALDADGEPLGPGAPVTLDRHYSFSSAGSTYDAHERLAFALVGPAEVIEENRGHPCI